MSMSRFNWFDTFDHRTELRARLVLRTGLRIGSGRNLEGIGTDLPVLRDGRDRLFIPGSSLKGVVRAAGEGLLRGFAVAHHAETWRFACDPLVRGCLDMAQDEGLIPEHMGDADDIPALERVERAHRRIERFACLACRTFGAPGLASHLRFEDAFPVDSAWVQVRDGVAIDRDLGRVHGSQKYDYEVIEPGAVFELRVAGINLEDWQLGLLLAALDLLFDGTVRIGGFGSRGLGRVELDGQLENGGVQIWRRTLDDVIAQRQGHRLKESERSSSRAAFVSMLTAHTDAYPAGGGR